MAEMAIFLFDLCDLVHVFERNGPDGFVTWCVGTFFDAGGALEKVGHGWGADLEGCGTIGVGNYLCGQWGALDVDCGCGVEVLAELHDVDAHLAETWADRWRWCGFSRRKCHFDHLLNDTARHL